MPRLFLILTTLLYLSVMATGQRKLILYNPEESHIFRIGDEIGVTQKGQPFVFGNWKTICKPCDTTIQKNLWKIDSIAETSFTLTRITSYRFDTLSYDDYITMVKAYKKLKKPFPLIESTFYRDTPQDSLKSEEETEMCVLKTPKIAKQTVYYDSLESITLSRFTSNEYCSRGYIIFPAAIGLLGVYAIITEAVKSHPNKRILWIAIGPAISGAILTKMGISMRNNNVETIHREHFKIKIK